MHENIQEFPSFIELAHALQADAVQFWPLHDYSPSQTATWEVERNGWTFVYRNQMLGQNEDDAASANAIIDKGISRAEELGVPIIWPVGGRIRIVFQPDNSLLETAGECSPTMASPAVVEEKGFSESKAQPREDLRGCVAPWEWMAISEAGDVRPCCYIEKPLGNLRESSPEELWNGSEYREMRRDLARGILPRQCRNAACKYVRSGWIYMG